MSSSPTLLGLFTQIADLAQQGEVTLAPPPAPPGMPAGAQDFGPGIADVVPHQAVMTPGGFPPYSALLISDTGSVQQFTFAAGPMGGNPVAQQGGQTLTNQSVQHFWVVPKAYLASQGLQNPYDQLVALS